MTDRQTMDSTTLFEAALSVKAPWFIKNIEFDVDGQPFQGSTMIFYVWKLI